MPKLQNGDPWTVDVDVCLSKPDVDPPEFEIRSSLQQKEGGPLVFCNRGRPGFKVSFHLHDESNSGYRFPRDPKMAVWSKVKRGSSADPECSTDHNDKADEVFKAPQVINDGSTLVVNNPNRKPAQGKFWYALRLTRDDNNYIVLDPPGENQNGTGHG